MSGHGRCLLQSNPLKDGISLNSSSIERGSIGVITVKFQRF